MMKPGAGLAVGVAGVSLAAAGIAAAIAQLELNGHTQADIWSNVWLDSALSLASAGLLIAGFFFVLAIFGPGTRDTGSGDGIDGAQGPPAHSHSELEGKEGTSAGQSVTAETPSPPEITELPVAPGTRPGLTQNRVTVTADDDPRDMTANFIDEIGATKIWGEQRADLVRMVLYELVLNATSHGNVTAVTLTSEPGWIGLAYDGPKFGLNDLLQVNPRGGGDAIRVLRNEASGVLELNYRYQNSRNEWLILDDAWTGAADNPCGIQLLPGKGRFIAALSAIENCDEVHVYADDRWSFSDLHGLANSVYHLPPNRQFVVHGIDPYGALAQRLRELLPGTRIILSCRPVK